MTLIDDEDYQRRKLREAGFVFSPDTLLSSQLLEEILYAINVPIHEHRRATYGAIIVTSKPTRVLRTEPKQHLDLSNAEAGRQLADGRFSFLVRCGDISSLVVLSRHFGDEYSAYSIRDAFLLPWAVHEAPPIDLGLIQLTESGVIRVLGPKNIAVRRNNSWTVKDYKYAYVEGMDLSASLSGLEVPTLREATALCVHGLSDRHVGATLVVKRTPGPFEDVTYLERAQRSLGIMIDDTSWHYALMALQAQKDGAMLIRYDGEVEAIGAELQVDHGDKLPGKGTRHTSARAYSRTHRDCIVLVSSEEGPVTVYIAGAVVPPRDPALARPPRKRRTLCHACGMEFIVDGQYGQLGGAQCPSCDKTLGADQPSGVLRPYAPLDGGGSGRKNEGGARRSSPCGSHR